MMADRVILGLLGGSITSRFKKVKRFYALPYLPDAISDNTSYPNKKNGIGYAVKIFFCTLHLLEVWLAIISHSRLADGHSLITANFVCEINTS